MPKEFFLYALFGGHIFLFCQVVEGRCVLHLQTHSGTAISSNEFNNKGRDEAQAPVS